jgi:hypothetical protein
LAAEGLGLGSNLVQSFDEDKISEIIGLPEYIRPVAIIAIGYPAEEVKEKERITFENLTSVEKWGEKFEISYVIQPGAKRDIKPIGNIIEEAIEKQKGKSGKKLIDEILKRLSKIDFKL